MGKMPLQAKAVAQITGSFCSQNGFYNQAQHVAKFPCIILFVWLHHCLRHHSSLFIFQVNANKFLNLKNG